MCSNSLVGRLAVVSVAWVSLYTRLKLCCCIVVDEAVVGIRAAAGDVLTNLIVLSILVVRMRFNSGCRSSTLWLPHFMTVLGI